MVIDDVKKSHNVKLLDYLSSYFVSISFLVVISIFLVSFLSKCLSFCKDVFKKKKAVSTSNYEPLNIKQIKKTQHYGHSDYKKAIEFEIPGVVSCESIQPCEDSISSESSTTADASEKVFLEEYVQPSAETMFSISRKLQIAKQLAKKKISERNSTVISSSAVEGFEPDLYQACPLKVQGASMLGKVKFTLQYEDKFKKKLIMMLHNINNLKFNKSHEQVKYMHVSVSLLPEREYVFKTKDIGCAPSIKLEDTFSFQSRPRNRDFESRTVVIAIAYICPLTGKELLYGEARLPLLSHEIYSQVPTDIAAGISPPSQPEVGDAQILLSFSSVQHKLNIIVKSVQFTNTTMFDKLSGIHIKCYLLRVDGGEKYGKKKTISKSFRASDDSHLVEFQEPMDFHLESENYLLCSLKLSIHGKHRIMGKHLSLGKIRIGENSNNEGGKVHWKTVLNSQEIAWTMWHPIYSN